MPFTPTPEQLAIFEHLRSTSEHLIIDALAGTGKSSTLEEALPLLKGTSIVLAFNRSIADDWKARIGNKGLMVAAMTQAATAHSHGLASFRASGHKPQTQSGKLSFMLRDQIADYPADDLARKNTRHISRLASLAKANGFGLSACDGRDSFPAITDYSAWLNLVQHFSIDVELEGDYDVDDLIEEAQALLQASNRRISMIDFDDMIYLALLLNLPIKQYDNVLLDEAQDINATRRELAFRSLKPNGRLIVVGDKHQAIYGFTGADSKSMDNIARRAGDPKRLPLSICWRCSDKVLDEARKLVPGIKTAPANVGKGEVRNIPYRQEGGHMIPAIDFLAHPAAGDAILCRLNKPLIATCLGLIRRGTPAKIEGRDIGKKLLGHVQKANERYAMDSLADTITELEAYKATESYKLASKNREAAAALLEDEVDAAILLCERVIETQGQKAGWRDLEALALQLFGDDVRPNTCVTLSSIHKAKGREWPRVYLLGKSDYMPFFKAEQPHELEQEYNLIYVAQTRAKRELIYVTGVASAIDKGLHRLPALATS